MPVHYVEQLLVGVKNSEPAKSRILSQQRTRKGSGMIMSWWGIG